MIDGQANAPTGSAGGGRQDDYAKIETALQQTPRGRWFLDEYARRNRHADTAMVLAAIERLEGVVKGEAEGHSASKAGAAAIALPYAQLKCDAETAAQDVADMEQATKDATADILLATEAIQDFTWEMRDKGIDRATCETIERHTADIYAACSFQDVVYQRKENAIHLLRLMAEALEAALGKPQADGRGVASSSAKDMAAPMPEPGAPPGAPEPELEIPLASGLTEQEADNASAASGGWERQPASQPEAQLGFSKREDAAIAPPARDVPNSGAQPDAAQPHARGDLHGTDEALTGIDKMRLAVLFG